MLEGRRADAADIGLVIHGTTLATNALIERKRRQDRVADHRRLPRHAGDRAPRAASTLYDVTIDKPTPLVPRELRLEVPRAHERQGRAADGRWTRTAVNELIAGADQAREVESVADGLPARLRQPRARAARRARAAGARRCRA